MNRFALSLLLLTACATDEVDDLAVDDAVADTGKADSIDARHYLLTSAPFPDELDARTLTRAGGGKLRCPNGELAEACAIHIGGGELEATPGLATAPEVLLDEVEDHAIMLRGRIVKNADGYVVMRASAATRMITSVMPSGPCYRVRPQPSITYRFELLDGTKAIATNHVYLDEADPTPDFWGQPTPAVQAKIDDGMRLAATRPVYTCGFFEKRDADDWYWGNSLFVPR